MLATIRQQQEWRQRQIIEARQGFSIFCNGASLINLASNDYLNLSQHPKVKEAFAKAALYYGLGSSASPLVTGFQRPHFELEERFSHFLKRRALLFNSGYHANLAVFQTLAKRSSVIFSDKECHASLLDGIQLSRAVHRRFPHHHFGFLAKLLDNYKTEEKIIITESIFSMSGDLTPLKKVAALSQEKKALLCLDDAHGLGFLGEEGRGAAEHFGLQADEIFCLTQPLGKAIGGMGAILSGNKEVIELVLQQGRSYRYSTALPPAIASAMLVALDCLETEAWRRRSLRENIALFNQLATDYQLPLISADETPIRALLLGSNEKALACHAFLKKQGYLGACIRPNTVPKNKALIRLSLSSELTKATIKELAELLALFFQDANSCF